VSKIDDIVFLDTETRTLPGRTSNLKDDGTYRYVRNSGCILLTAAADDKSPVEIAAAEPDVDTPLHFDELPDLVRRHADKVLAGKAVFAAFNAGFDRAVWNSSIEGTPYMGPGTFIDTMAQVTASNLPPSLEGASQTLRLGGKQPDGKALIQLFCFAGGKMPDEEPEKWERFKSYAVEDTRQLRLVHNATRPLSLDEWEDYWTSEEINERGIAIDLPFVEAAAAVAEANRAALNQQLTRWTNGQITAVTQVKRIAEYVYDMMESSEARQIMVTEFDEDAEDDVKQVSLSLDRRNIETLLAYFNSRPEITEREQTIINVLEARQYGGSASPLKFKRMLDQHVDGRLCGQYVFNGAQQTGRFSSKGVQIHNLTRSSLKKLEPAAIEMLNELVS
jgi:DNA polymerase